MSRYMIKFISIYPDGESCDLEIICNSIDMYHYLAEWHKIDECQAVGYYITYDDSREKYNLN